MAFDVYLGHTSKRYNSTSQPSYDDWDKFTAVFKNAKDIDAPTIELFIPGKQEYPQYNAMYMPVVDSWYWITSIVSVRANVWQVSGVMDVLATYRSDIMATNAYVLYGFNRSAGASDIRLRDDRQNVSQVPQVSTAQVDITGETLSLDAGCFILSAVGANGGVNVWMIPRVAMKALINSIGRDITDAIADLDETEILKFFTSKALTQGSAISAIRSCIWLPIKANQIPAGEGEHVYLGDFDTGVTGKPVNATTIIKKETSVSIPWPVSDWRRMNTQIICYVPFVGTVAVPVDQCNGAAKLHFTWCVEVLSGGVSLRIDADQYPVYTGSANIGCNYAIGSSNVPTTNFISGTIQAVGGVIQAGGGISGAIVNGLTGGLLGDDNALGNIAQGMSNVGQGAIQALTPVVQCAGSLSGNAAMGQSTLAKVVVLYYNPIDDAAFSAVYGHPVMQIAKPVSGYCKTLGFSVGGNQRAAEKSAIAALMDSGVFIE